jgi:release factor glutamine methyltransferase
MKTIAELLAWYREETLLCHVLNCTRAFLHTWPEKVLTEKDIEAYVKLANRHKQGEPLAYILGHAHFWDHEFLVNVHTLIPRPETEILIETLLSILPDFPLKIVDVGTGSGIIACTLSLERKQWEIFATDISPEALAVAQENAKRLNAKVQFLQGDFLSPLNAEVDVIVSNPPYIAQNDPHLKDLQHEPQGALVSGETGLEAFEKIISQSQHHLKSGGVLAFEHGYDQDLKNIMQSYFRDIITVRDLAGHPRVTLGKKNGKH